MLLHIKKPFDMISKPSSFLYFACSDDAFTHISLIYYISNNRNGIISGPHVFL